MKTLSSGSTGNEVKVLQKKLGVVVDGSFGPLTVTNLKNLQSAYGLKPDGICGPLTWARVLTTKVLDYTLSNATYNILRVNKHEVDFGLTYDVKPLGIKAIVANNKADFTMNAGMYNNAPSKVGYGLTIVDTIIDGKVVGGGNYVPRGFGFSDTDIGITTTEIAKVNYPSFIGFSPDLYPNMNLKGLSVSFANALAYRTGVGIKGDFIFFITTNSPMNLNTFKKKFVELGCVDAGNFDGGGSTQSALYIDDMYIKQTNSTDSRKNATYLTVSVKKKIVVIDEGHGGDDPGTHSNTPLMQEKDVNHNMGTELSRLFTNSGKYKVIRTRPNNETVSLEQRAEIINNIKPDMTISIHNNAGGGTGYDIIYKWNSKSSLKMAELIGKEYELLGQTKHGIYYKLRSDGKDYYAMHRWVNTPIITSEFAFMDTNDVLDIDTIQEQNNVARALFNATNQFFNI